MGKHFTSGSRIALLSAVGMAVAAVVPACQTIPENPSERNAYRQQRLVDLMAEIRRAHELEMQQCLTLPAGPDRASCFVEARAKHERALQQYYALLALIEQNQHEEDMEAIRRHYEALRELIKKIPEWEDVLPLLIPLKNLRPLLPQGTTLAFDIDLVSQTSVPATLLWVDGMEVTSAAAGVLMKWAAANGGTAVPPEGAIQLDNSVYELATTARSYKIPTGAGGTMSLGGASGAFGLSGQFSFVDRIAQGNRSVITSLDATITMFGKKLSVVLDQSAYNSLVVKPDGTGALHFRAVVGMDDEMEHLHFPPSHIMFEVPVIYSAATGALRLATPASGSVFQRVLPIQWYRSSDFNRDGSLSAADLDAFVLAWQNGNLERTDLDANGILNQADIEIFSERFAEDASWLP